MTAAEFDAIERGELAADPTLYACVSSVTDATQAPDGCENWFVLVNTPAGVEVDVATPTATLVLDRLAAARRVDSRVGSSSSRSVTPRDIEERYRSPGGAIYGTSSDGMRAAFLRPANRGPVAGLYLVGGSSHPGGGLPLVAVERADRRRHDRERSRSMSAAATSCPTPLLGRGSPPRPSPSPGSPAPPGWPRRSGQPRNCHIGAWHRCDSCRRDRT